MPGPVHKPPSCSGRAPTASLLKSQEYQHGSSQTEESHQHEEPDHSIVNRIPSQQPRFARLKNRIFFCNNTSLSAPSDTRPGSPRPIKISRKTSASHETKAIIERENQCRKHVPAGHNFPPGKRPQKIGKLLGRTRSQGSDLRRPECSKLPNAPMPTDSRASDCIA